MATTIGKLRALLTGDAGGFGASMDNARRSLRQLGAEGASLSDVLGKRSGLKEFAEVLAGGGVIVGATMAARALANMSEGLAKLSVDARNGQKDFRELLYEVGRTIPVASDAIRFMEGVSEVVTGNGAQAARTAQRWVAARDALKSFSASSSAAIDELSAILDRLREADRLRGLEGFALQMEQAGMATDKLNERIGKIAIQFQRSADAARAAAKAINGDIMFQVLAYADAQERVYRAYLDQAMAATRAADAANKLQIVQEAAAQAAEGMLRAGQLGTVDIDDQWVRDAEAADAAAAAGLRELQAEAERTIAATRTPLEAYEDSIGRLSRLLNAGLIDWETYGRAVQQAKDELERPADVRDIDAPEAVEAGSREAAAFAVRMESQAMNRQQQAEQDLLRENQVQTATLEAIRRNTRKPVEIVVARI